jgi:hypothetical protein
MPYGKISTMIQKDLIIIGEWMAPIILKNTGRRLAEYKSNLSDYTGFWNAVSCVDINNDGKKDLILGNKGTNTTYKASKENPMRLFVNDFDNNGTIEQIATRFIDGKDTESSKILPILLLIKEKLCRLRKEIISIIEIIDNSIKQQ